MKLNTMKKFFVLLISFFILYPTLDAQYFGRNKPRYRNFDFKVRETDNFDIHFYMKNRDAVDRIAQQTEQWHDMIQQILRDTFYVANPIIFYNNHAEFQQTNASTGIISVGTGGFTDFLKNRVVMPFTHSNQATNQVLGHELVHAFQLKMVIQGDSTNMESLAQIPLWMIEGMAEYMSLGRVDPFTSMWMRDALLNDNIPDLKKMANPRYFPYRYGQALWSYLAGFYGDDVIEPIFKYTAKYGLEPTFEHLLGEKVNKIGENWKAAMEEHYAPYMNNKKERFIGKKLLSKENSGRINVSPALSPNGRYVVFLSEKDLFSTDLFMADAKTGKIIRKLASLAKDSNLDALNALESSGAWSPDSKEFAFVGFEKGQNVILIKNASSGKLVKKIKIPKVPSIASLVFTPDGDEIVFSGLVEGQADLYAVKIRNSRVRQITDDVYSEIQPNFNLYGDKLAFSYDKQSMVDGRTFGKYTYDIAVMDYASGEINILDVFHQADNLNPSFDHEGNIYFISDRDGRRNLYRYIPASEEVYQMTDLVTGISGISRYSPAITVSTKRDRVLFNHYFDNGYDIYQASSDKLLNYIVSADDLDFTAGTLPVTGLGKTDIVNNNLNNIDNLGYVDPSTFRTTKYDPHFRLDDVRGGTGVGVGNSTFGDYVGLQGGISMVFGDILGANQIFSQVSLNGEIYDIGGQGTYINRKNRLAWGLGLSHIPIRTGSYNEYLQNVEIDGQTFSGIGTQLDIIRIFDKGLNAFAHYPFSTTLRLEGGISGQHRGFRADRITSTYLGGAQLVAQERERLELGDELRFNNYFTLQRGFGTSANVALVGDNSYFGLTSPLAGQRFRLSLERNFGFNDFYGALADYRRYFWLKPLSIAFRGMAYGRFEKEVNSIYPIWLGQMGFVRGYDYVFEQNPNNNPGNIDFRQMLGSKMGMFNAEVRLPFTGPKSLALISSKFFLSDLAIFFDSGIVFNEFDHLSDGQVFQVLDRNGNVVRDPVTNEIQTENIKPALAMSLGVSMRINVLGALIVEPYFAWPLQPGTRRQFGFNLIPGW